jgi:CheY-like chemotaxis protein
MAPFPRILMVEDHPDHRLILRHSLRRSCDDYLTKPLLDFTLLQQKITQLLAKGRTP